MIRPILICAALLASAKPAMAVPPPAPLSRAEVPARAAQLARAYVAICRADDMALAAMNRRAAAQGFTLQPERTRTSRRGFSNGTVVTELLLKFPDGDTTQPFQLSAMLTEERDATGKPGEWACELRLPASGFAVPPAEAKSVFKIVRTILERPDWQVETAKTPMGAMTGSSRVEAGIEETYAGTLGSHLLGRRPRPPSQSITIPR